MLSNSQKRLGYREVVYNFRNESFWMLEDGDNYLSVTLDLDGGGHTASNFTFDASIIPDTNSAYDLGSAEFKVRHLYLSDNSVKFESGDLGVTGGNLQFDGVNLLKEDIASVLNVLGVLSFPDNDGALGGGLVLGDVYFNTNNNRLASVN